MKETSVVDNNLRRGQSPVAVMLKRRLQTVQTVQTADHADYADYADWYFVFFK